MSRLRLPIWALVLIVIAGSGSVAYAAVSTGFINRIINPPDFAVTALPVSQGVPQGGITAARVTLTSINGFAGTVSLSVTVSPGGTNVPSVTVNPSSLTLAANAVGVAHLNISAANIVSMSAPGYMLPLAFNLTVVGASGGHSHSAQVSVTVLDLRWCSVGFICPSFSNPVFVSISQDTTTLQVSPLQVNNNAAFPINVYSYYYTDLDKIQVGGEYTLNSPMGSHTFNTFSVTQPGVQVNGITIFWQTPLPPPTLTSHTKLNATWAALGQGPKESLGFENSSINSATNATSWVRNTGTVSVTFTSYSVKDTSGDTYSLASWAGPTINPSVLMPVNILIGSSCASCVLTGNPFNFSLSDTVTFVTTRGSTFTFSPP